MLHPAGEASQQRAVPADGHRAPLASRPVDVATGLIARCVTNRNRAVRIVTGWLRLLVRHGCRL